MRQAAITSSCLLRACTWAQADAAAKARSNLGIQGHLATITSPHEEEVIRALIPAPQGSRNEVWVGGTKGNCSNGEVGCYGRWNNGGLILDDDNTTEPTGGFTRLSPYTHWQTDQPDNSDNATTLAFGPGADGFFGLDDQNKTNAILGYVAEFGDQSESGIGWRLPDRLQPAGRPRASQHLQTAGRHRCRGPANRR